MHTRAEIGGPVAARSNVVELGKLAILRKWLTPPAWTTDVRM